MAGADRMTIEQVVREVLLEDHADVVRESVRWVVQQLMESEVSELVGAELGERRPDDRATHRNGYRSRRWDTRAGEIELQIPKLRQGSYFPSFLQPRKRSEQALVAVVQQAYVCGVSTRRVDQLVESLGLRVSRSEVSRICAGLDEQVEAFRTRPLEGRYPYLFVDAKVEKVRDGGRVARKCVVIAHAVHETGRREIIGLDVGEAETEAFWREFLRSLVKRGLVGVQLAISDAHPGLKTALEQVLGAPWQRCTVHFLRDCLAAGRVFVEMIGPGGPEAGGAEDEHEGGSTEHDKSRPTLLPMAHVSVGTQRSSAAGADMPAYSLQETLAKARSSVSPPQSAMPQRRSAWCTGACGSTQAVVSGTSPGFVSARVPSSHGQEHTFAVGAKAQCS